MKRVLLSLLGILIVAGFCMAQAGDFRQQGRASQVMQTNGMTAAHPSLPIGSSARVINTATNHEIEVTITGRIMPSLDRIIDLSPTAAQTLGIGGGGYVIITTASPPLPQPVPPPVQEPPAVVAVEPAPAPPPVPVLVVVVEPEPELEPEPEPEQVVVAVVPNLSPLPEAAPPQQQQPIAITIHNYIVVPDNTPEEHRDRPMRQYRNTTVPAPEPHDVHEEVLHALPPQEPPLMNLEPPINGVIVIPGLPDPHNNRVYRLQVGAYSGTGSASLTMRRVEAAGFVPTHERYGNLLRVFIDDIPSSNVQSAVQRLAALGFTQVWVRE